MSPYKNTVSGVSWAAIQKFSDRYGRSAEYEQDSRSHLGGGSFIIWRDEIYNLVVSALGHKHTHIRKLGLVTRTSIGTRVFLRRKSSFFQGGFFVYNVDNTV